MKLKNSKVRKCACGKLFTVIYSNTRYCSDECREESKRMRYRETCSVNNEIKRAERKARKNKQKSISNIAAEAKKAGMSYGEYVAISRHWN